jgi:membrane-bound ClpP family serine protease
MEFEVIIGVVIAGIVIIGLVFLVIKGFKILLALSGIGSIIFGFLSLFAGLEGLAFGVPLILSGGLLIVVADLMEKTSNLEKRYDKLVTAVNALNIRNEKSSNSEELN